MVLTLLSMVQRSIESLCQTVKQNIRQRIKPDTHQLVFSAIVDLTRPKAELVLENAFLRQQLIVLQRQKKRPTLTGRDRVMMVFLASKLRRWKEALIIVQPDTLLRWHRDLFRWVWRRKSKAKGRRGREPLTVEDVALIRKLAKENRSWGAERIRGELLKLGKQVSKSTIQKYMAEVRKRGSSKMAWATFLRNHASQVWACDFLQTYDALFRTIFVFVIIELGSRRVVHMGVTRNPTDEWAAQQLREATPFGEGPRYLIRDNDGKYGESFGRVTAGIKVLRTPYQAPKANAVCERFLGSLRRECLDYFLILNERSLHRIMKEYGSYFNDARPHQGIEQQIPCKPRQHASPPVNGKVISHSVLGGLHHDYSWRTTQFPFQH